MLLEKNAIDSIVFFLSVIEFLLHTDYKRNIEKYLVLRYFYFGRYKWPFQSCIDFIEKSSTFRPKF